MKYHITVFGLTLPGLEHTKYRTEAFGLTLPGLEHTKYRTEAFGLTLPVLEHTKHTAPSLEFSKSCGQPIKKNIVDSEYMFVKKW